MINTSRAGVIKTDDLVEALENGVIAGAGLDVFENLPLPKNDPLLNLKNVVLTPYVAFTSYLGNKRTMDKAIGCILDYNKGRIPENLIDPENYK